MNKKEQILNIIDAIDMLKHSYWNTVIMQEDADLSDLEVVNKILNDQAETFDTLANKLMKNVEEFTGVNDNDFIGDGYFMLCEEAFSNNLSSDEILEKFQEVDVVAQREWIIHYNLNMLDEFHEKYVKGIDKERSREIFDARLKLLLEQTSVPDVEKLRYTKMLLDYVKGKIDRREVAKEYEYFIYK